MKIRTRLLLSIVPPVVALFVVSSIVGYTVSSSGLYNLERDFLRFKAQLLQNYMSEQWNLLVDFSLYTRPEYLQTAQTAVGDFASSILKPLPGEEEGSAQVVFAIAETSQNTRTLVLITDPDLTVRTTDINGFFNQTDDARGVTRFSFSAIGGENYAFTSFYFEPFRWTVFVAEPIRVFGFTNTIVQRVFIISTLLSIVVLLGILFALSKSLTYPLRRMATTAEQVTEDLATDIQIPHIYNDEAGVLARTLNTTFKELEITYRNLKQYAFESAVSKQQEQRVRTVFQKYVPQDLINRYIKNPESLLLGENREVAVLFSDIRGFTKLAESMQPDQVVRFLNRYLKEVIDVIDKAEGVVDKFIGDAVMALFGAPIAHEDDVVRAVNVALQMLAVVEALNARADQEKTPRFDIGIGMHFGTVTVGNIGSHKKVEYTAIGDTVNLASRLEGLCKQYEQSIMVSITVASVVKKSHPLRFIDKIIVKGKSTPTQIFTILPNAKHGKEEAYRAYQKGIDQYYSRDFREAQNSFEEAKRGGLDDRPTNLFLTRCQELLVNPPPDQWDGAVKLETK